MSDAAPSTGTPAGVPAPDPDSTSSHTIRTAPRHASPGWLLGLIAAGIFFGTLDQTVVVTVLPDILKDIRLPVNTRFGEAPWIVTGYLLGYTAAMPIVGRIADVYGRVRVFVACLVVFSAGSVLVAVAPNLQFIVAARCLQAVGGGGLLPVGLAIAADVTGPRRALALGTLAAANNGSTFLGPVWGAVVAGLWSWRTIFWLNLPLVVPMMLAMPLLAHDQRSGSRPAIDWRGAALLAVGLSAATFALTDDGANPRPLTISLALLAVGVAVLAVFTIAELRSAAPMIDLTVLRLRRVSAAMLAYFLVGCALITALVNVPLMTNVLYGGSTTEGGLTLMRLLLLLPLGGVAGGWLCTRLGYRSTVLAGLALSLGGFLWMRGWPYVPGDGMAAEPSTWHLWGALGAIGFGLGLCDGPIVATVVDAIHERQRATGAALLIVVWTAGMIVGLALLATQGLGAFSQKIASGDTSNPHFLPDALHSTFDLTFLWAAAALAVAFVLAWGLRSDRAVAMRVSPYEGFGEQGER